MADGQQPSSKWCFVCGVENQGGLHVKFFNDGPKRCIARVTLGNTFQSYPGIAHGGILATLLDETVGRALLTEGDPIETPRFLFTARLEIRYKAPVPLNQEITVRGWIDSDRGRKVEASGDIVLADGTVAVQASATLIEIPQDKVQEMKVQDTGWQVYP